MESFTKLKRRGTDLLNSLPQNMPSMPSMPQVQMPAMPAMPAMPSMPRFGGGPNMNGTWQHLDLPSLPRSSHSLDIIAGNAYIFGGEGDARRPADNDMHVVVLPWSGAPADYYAIKAKPSPKPSADEDTARPTAITEEDETEAQLRDPLTDVPLGSSSSSPPPPSSDDTEAEASTSNKGKGKAPETADVPSPRVGHASAVIGTRIFLFGGRPTGAGAAPPPLDEKGRVWVFETRTHTWTYLDPHHSSPIPPPRSDHSAVATEKPRDFSVRPMKLRRSSTWKEWAEGDSAEVGIPQRPIAGAVAESATDDEAAGAGFGTLIIHAGRLPDGTLASDVWSFDVHARTWKQLPDAPGPGRCGAALALVKSRLYRFGGFDGLAALGGQLDVLRLGLDEFDDQIVRGELGVFARGTWDIIYAPPPPPSSSTSSAAQETAGLTASSSTTALWPAPRSAASFTLVQAGGGREYLVLAHGEASPASEEGEAGVGAQPHADVWAFEVPAESGTAASLTDALLHSLGRKSGDGTWFRVVATPFDDDSDVEVDGTGDEEKGKGRGFGPAPRAHFAAAPLGALEENAVFVSGGVSVGGKRVGDGWILRLE
ncbi:hypothetical protein F4777DRAFT_503121 [Nemania sp. FL0916]|nr:hypothetical protein F4777DRAFT_503121 [Nemania sp. FL0916]